MKIDTETIICIFLIILIFIGAYFSLNYKKIAFNINEWTIDSGNAFLCDYQLDESLRNLCNWDFARKSDDLSYCYKLVGREYKNDCIVTYGVRHENLSICESLSNVSQKHICYNAIGENTNNWSLCEKYGEPLYLCFKKMISNQNDSSLCDKLMEVNREYCKFEIARRTKDLTICDNMTYGINGYKSLCEELPARNWT